jgi:hypothetical protein
MIPGLTDPWPGRAEEPKVLVAALISRSNITTKEFDLGDGSARGVNAENLFDLQEVLLGRFMGTSSDEDDTMDGLEEGWVPFGNVSSRRGDKVVS